MARPSQRSAWGGDKELEVGSRAHYDDPAYYTKTYQRRTDDVAFYVELAKRYGADVLEYGAGNGRIAIPVARTGLRVTGVDCHGRCSPILRRAYELSPRTCARG